MDSFICIMKNIFYTVLILFFISCRDEPNHQNTTALEDYNKQIQGTWTPSYYEYKGKIYPVNDCQKSGRILVSSDMSGTYEVYDMNGSCQNLNNYIGIWSYGTNGLSITYTENGVSKIKNLPFNTISDSELKLYDNSKNLDGLGGLDEAILVYIK